MSPYRPPDYLEKARSLRASRLGTPPAPVRPIHPSEVPKVPFPEPVDSTVKATRKHALIATPDQLAELATTLQAATRVGLDLETTGLDPRRDRVRLLSLATERGVWLVDCFEADPHALFGVLAEKELVIHNALFDLGFLYQMGFELGENGEVLDTMLSSQIVVGLQPKDKEDA
jgi:DNA polymerase III epsilon subunit-like protein